MKVLYHVISALVGITAAALIVYLVFGNASLEGARQEGAAPESLSSEGSALCGTVTPAAATSPGTRRTALANFPSLADGLGPIPAIRDDQPAQKSWVARVHAATGLCADSITFPETGLVEITMSTVKPITGDQASLFAAGALAQAFTAPINPRQVTLVATVGDTTRRVVVGQRAWRAFQVRRQQLGVPLSMRSLVQFRQAVYRQPDLRISGWS